MKLDTLYPDLAPLVKGSSFNQLFQFFWTAGQVRYATRKHLAVISFKLGTKNKTDDLVRSGYFQIIGEAFSITDKVKAILEEQKYPVSILQKKFTGATPHDLKITDVILDLKPWAVFYPIFRESRPDACLIFKKDRAYKIQFLEVENTEKPASYLRGKKEEYEKLARDFEMYDRWWKHHAEKLGLPFPKPENFCFSVLCFGSKKEDWSGWTFSDSGDKI
jgi:hypothetical protein